jgi:putative flippase GtrA
MALLRLSTRVGSLAPEVTKFGVTGIVAYTTEVTAFNLCLAAFGVSVVASSLAGSGAGTAVAYLGNRHWTYGGRQRGGGWRTCASFLAVNLVGAGIIAGCVAVSHFALGLDSLLADNVAKNVVGMALAMLFRFWAYRTWVFPVATGARESGQPARTAPAGVETARTATLVPRRLPREGQRDEQEEDECRRSA